MPSLTTLHCPSCNSPIGPGTKFCSSCGHHLEQADEQDALVGRFIGDRFLVQAKLGEGGMGAVYQAEQVAMKRPVALKVLHPHLSRDDNLIERFHREAAASSRLNHPNTITVHDFGQADDGTLYIAMEFIDGKSLADEIEGTGAFPWYRVTEVGRQIAESLADAHAAGIVHRDLKPDNVMLISRANNTDFVKILDFGIAKMVVETAEEGDQRKALTRTGMIFGTPQYMSPEQVTGSAVDHRTDIYALGVILYELLVGELPFLSENAMGVLTKHLMDPPRPLRSVMPSLTCPPGLEALVMRCLAKEPAHRYQTMNELVGELKALGEETRPGFGVIGQPAGGSGAPAFASVQTPSGAFAHAGGSGGYGQQPTSGPYPQQAPSGAFGQQVTPAGAFGQQATPAGFGPTVESGAFAQGQSGSAAGWGEMGSNSYGGPSGHTPAATGAQGAPGRPRRGKTIFALVFVVLLLAGLAVGAAFAWKALAQQPGATPPGPSQPAADPVVPPAADNPATTTAESTATPAALATAATGPDAAAGARDSSVATATSPPTPPPTPAARCTVATVTDSVSKALSRALTEREEQMTLCLAPLLAQDFNGAVELTYQWSRTKGPHNFKRGTKNFNNEAVTVCLQTAIQMVQHPKAKRLTKASFALAAQGSTGKLRSCSVKASVRRARRGGGHNPKPDAWGVPQGHYPYGRR
jgi:tRNA A-37 threonylcarbamoyl transferase component Bud32